jgi:hypothetical protein
MKKEIIQLKNVRTIYPFLFRKKIWDNKDNTDNTGDDKNKYQAGFIIPRSHEVIKQLHEQMALIKKDKFDGKGFLSCLKDIDNLREESDKYSSQDYDNSFLVTAKSKYKPSVVENYQNTNSSTGKKEKVFITDEFKIKSGDYVNAFIELVPYDKPKKGVSAKLLGVQFWKHGEAFPNTTPNFDTFIDEENTESNDFEIPDDMDF